LQNPLDFKQIDVRWPCYRAVDSKTEFSPFLLKEWGSKKQSKIRYYIRLSSFIRDHFPNIKLATEFEKGILIKELAESPTFKATRRTLKSLVKFDDFTLDQANEILEAAVRNNQVYWIADEPFVRRDLEKILSPHEGSLDQSMLEEYEERFKKKKADQPEAETADTWDDLLKSPDPLADADDEDVIPF
jgi:hypothetical protein